LVTEGRVRVGRAATEGGQIFQALAAGREPPMVVAGEGAVFSLMELTSLPTVAEISTEDIAEFNRRSRHQLVIGDAAVGAELIGGTFRPNNVEAFVRLLGVTNRVRAEVRGENETVLRSGR
jgi:ferric-dicitrate binding protein FerR (iron transport regulator)